MVLIAKLFEKPKPKNKEVDRKFVRYLVSRHGMSEPSLFLGRYVTREDVEKMKKSIWIKV